VKRFVGLSVLWLACATNASKEITVNVIGRDGEPAGQFLRTADAGLVLRWVDGGQEFIGSSEEQACAPDVSGALGLLAMNECKTSVQCALVRPRVSGLKCCYATATSVAKSQELARALDGIERQCGTVDGICFLPCAQVSCRQGRCVAIGQ
jgi:hypothetical protein